MAGGARHDPEADVLVSSRGPGQSEGGGGSQRGAVGRARGVMGEVGGAGSQQASVTITGLVTEHWVVIQTRLVLGTGMVTKIGKMANSEGSVTQGQGEMQTQRRGGGIKRFSSSKQDCACGKATRAPGGG